MRVIAGVVLTGALWIALLFGWAMLIVATGGSFTECNRGDCGSLGELTMEATWPLVPLALLAVAALASWRVVSQRRA